MTAGPATCPVLVVDDDPDLRETLRDALEDGGFAVATACDGQEALDFLRSTPTPPCMVLLDLSMPVMDGATFRAEQRRDPALSSIPIVVFSAAGSLAEKVKHLDVADVLQKPLRLQQLLQTVRRYCVAS